MVPDQCFFPGNNFWLGNPPKVKRWISDKVKPVSSDLAPWFLFFILLVHSLEKFSLLATNMYVWCGCVGCGGVKATPKLPSTFDLQVNIAMIIALLIIILIRAAIISEIRWPDVYLI